MRHVPNRPVAAALFSLVMLPGAALAQALPPDPAEGTPMQIGPFYFRPTLDVTNVGTDSNVFNDSENPKDDFSATIVPSLQVIMRAGHARLAYTSRLDYVWFQKYSSERSVNSRSEGRFELRFLRFVPFVSGALVETRERPNAEIDLRAKRREVGLGAGAALVVGPAAAVTVAARQQTTNFASDQTFRGISLETALERTARALDAELRVDLTPLTTFSFKSSWERQEFEFTSSRDSRSVVLTPALEFSPSALLAGKVAVGYRRYDPVDPLLPRFRGVAANVDLTYLLGATTRIQGRVMQDVQNSFESEYPYYVGFGGQATITQQIAGPVDVQAIGGRQRLTYRQRGTGAQTTLKLDTYGGGVGARIGDHSRVGITVELTRRRGGEGLAGRDYDRQRIFGSFTYGF